MKRKGFTLVELLVVIAIIALLMGILMPVLGRVRALAHRVVCGSNLKGIAQAMLVYSNDYDGEFPRAGGRNSTWDTDGVIASWAPTQNTEQQAFGLPPTATITSSFYYLIKYSDVRPKQFHCRGDIDSKVFSLSDYLGALDPDFELADAWDFGDGSPSFSNVLPGQYCSYSYHTPYNENPTTPGYPIGSASDSSSPICADRNPFLDKNAKEYIQDYDTCVDWSTTENDIIDPVGDCGTQKYANSAAHRREGQNVAYADSHVVFESAPNVGIENDNIWIGWNQDDPPGQEDRQVGQSGWAPGDNGDVDSGPRSYKDAYLVGEKNTKEAL
jgi:prepilin-type N-terminal cleavage/methylation domain-containing protein